MFFIPGRIVGCATFPGIVIHQFARKLLCEKTGTEVTEVCWFQWENPMGNIVHEDPDSVWKQYLIGLGPVFVNTALAVLLTLLAMPFERATGTQSVPFFMLNWMALSAGMHAFPNTTDAASIWALSWESEDAPVWARVISVPFVGAVYLGAFARFFWADLIFGAVVVFGTRELVHWLTK